VGEVLGQDVNGEVSAASALQSAVVAFEQDGVYCAVVSKFFAVTNDVISIGN